MPLLQLVMKLSTDACFTYLNAKGLAVPELQIAEEFNIAVLYTNPVMSDPGAGAMFVVRLCTEYSCRQRSPALTTLCHQHLTLTYLP